MELKPVRIGIFGIALLSTNYGVTALGVSQLKVIFDICKQESKSIEVYVFSGENEHELETLKSYLPVENIKIKDIIRLRTGVKGWKNIAKDVNKCDLVIDLTYGDSFSDIYGIKNYFVYAIPKVLTERAGVPLVIGPQTIGPFYNKLVKFSARQVLSKANYLFVRDDLSLKQIQRMRISDTTIRTSDLAMSLPYNPDMYCLKGVKQRAGLNVSSLLWSGKSANIRLKLDYKRLIRTIIGKLDELDFEVHLITHVYESVGFTEYDLAKSLHEEFPGTILAPAFDNPMEAKSYISKMDVFLGSRMHATIGAFSAGVPVIPIAYSRKFEGLYNTLGYKYSVDCTSLTTDKAISMIETLLKTKDKIQADREIAFQKAVSLNNQYVSFLTDMIVEFGASNI